MPTDQQTKLYRAFERQDQEFIYNEDKLTFNTYEIQSCPDFEKLTNMIECKLDGIEKEVKLVMAE